MKVKIIKVPDSLNSQIFPRTPYTGEKVMSTINLQKKGGFVQLKKAQSGLTTQDSVNVMGQKHIELEHKIGYPGGTPNPTASMTGSTGLGIIRDYVKNKGYGSAMNQAQINSWLYNAGFNFDEKNKNENPNQKINPKKFILGEYYRKYTPYKKDDWDINWGWVQRKTISDTEADKLYSETVSKLPEEEQRVLINLAKDWFYKNRAGDTPNYGDNPDGSHKRDRYGAWSPDYEKVWNPFIKNQYNFGNYNETPILTTKDEIDYNEYYKNQTVPKSMRKQLGGQMRKYDIGGGTFRGMLKQNPFKTDPRLPQLEIGQFGNMQPEYPVNGPIENALPNNLMQPLQHATNMDIASAPIGWGNTKPTNLPNVKSTGVQNTNYQTITSPVGSDQSFTPTGGQTFEPKGSTQQQAWTMAAEQNPEAPNQGIKLNPQPGTPLKTNIKPIELKDYNENSSPNWMVKNEKYSEPKEKQDNRWVPLFVNSIGQAFATKVQNNRENAYTQANLTNPLNYLNRDNNPDKYRMYGTPTFQEGGDTTNEDDYEDYEDEQYLFEDDDEQTYPVENSDEQEEEIVPEESQEDTEGMDLLNSLVAQSAANYEEDNEDENTEYNQNNILNYSSISKNNLVNYNKNSNGMVDPLSLKNKIAAKESEGMGGYKAYNSDGGGEGAVGKYQFRWKLHKDWIMKLTGVSSKEEFLNNPEAQEKAFDYWSKTTLTPQAKMLQPLAPNMPLDKLKMLVHFRGPSGENKMGGAEKYLRGLQSDKPESYNMSTSKYIK